MSGSDRARAALGSAIALHQQVLAAGVDQVVKAATAITASLAGGGTVLVCGNGGSAADAQHAAAELVGRFRRERQGWAAIALTSDSSVLTSIANDYGFERVFARQVEALGRPGDVLLAISTSGASANVRAALEVARAGRMTTVALTGRDGGAVGADVDIHVNVASDDTPRVQEVHRTLLHILCDLIEDELAAKR